MHVVRVRQGMVKRFLNFHCSPYRHAARMVLTYAQTGFAVWLAVWIFFAAVAFVVQIVLKSMAKRSVMKASDSVCGPCAPI